MAFIAHIYNHGSLAHIYNQSIKILAALAAVKISSVSGRSIRVAMNWRLLLSISARSASSAVIGASGGEISEANHAS